MKKRNLLLSRLFVRHTCLWAVLGLLAALTFGLPPAQAAVTESWVHRYSNVVSNSDDQAVKVVRDAAGDIIVTGFTDDRIQGPEMLTIKYSGADGSVLWQQRHNGPANRDYSAVAVDGSGNVVVTGYSNGEYYTAKYAAADGALLWEQRSDGGGQAVAVDGSGSVVVMGGGMIKYRADGTGAWTNNGSGTALAVDGSGNVVVTGASYNGTNSDYYTAKYAAGDGALLWEQRYNGPANTHDSARAVAVDDSGNVVVTGGSGVFTTSPSDYYTAKYAAADGSLLWEKRYNGPANGYDSAHAVAVDASGNVVVTGYSNGEYYTAKYAAADGTLLWEKRYNGSVADDVATAVAVDRSGNVVVTGYSYTGTSERGYFGDYYTAKYAAANGALLWEKSYNGPANYDDVANGVTVDGNGNVVVTGYSFGSGSGFDYYTAKYAAADGALLWEQRHNNGPANNEDHANAMAVDGSGNVVVTGSSNNGTNSDSYTAKYAAGDGSLLWEQRYNGPANSEDRAQAVAVDENGNVVVTASSVGNGSDYDYYTAKYAAADGMLLWERRYNGPWTYDYAQALAVDGTGNVVVTGWSCGTNGYSDYYTAKYAAADGSLLWEQRYNGPANSEDRAQAVAVDGGGNVVVTGSSYGTNFNTDYYTAKYAAADGTLVWEKRDRGPANSYYSFATAVAVDGSGNVVVTGYSRISVGGDGADHYTAKYAAADGALLWEQHYYIPDPDCGYYGTAALAVDVHGNVAVTGGNYDYYTAKYASSDGALLWEKRSGGMAVAMDGNGNVVVSGSSYYTAKYAAADGALLWEQRYNGPTNGSGDTVSSLALGPNGMVAVTGSSSGDYATVVYRDDVYQISIALIPNGIRLRFTGIPGRSYTIERAPAVTGPWTAINTPTAPVSGLLEYIDAPPPPGSAFYRTVQP